MSLADAIETRNAQGIAAGIGRLITAGDLPVGDRLPTVRALARELDVSPTTVSEAWRILSAVGAIEARGRNGTFVRQVPAPGAGHRYRRVTEGPGHFALDLSTGTPDPALLPDLGPIVALVARQNLTSSYLDPPVLPQLEESLRSVWPFQAESLTVVDGAMDAIDRVAQVIVRLGDRVVVENPTFPPVLDLLDQLGAEVIGVDLDDEGISLTSLEAALAQKPSMVFLQPRAQNPTGITTSGRRARAIAKLLKGTGALVVEDDHIGDISEAPPISVGTWLPSQTVHIRSFSKSHGPDLRLAAVGGAGEVVDALATRRFLGPGWSSRILQAVLLALLRDGRTIDQITRAQVEYAARRAAFAAALADHGIAAPGTDGINQWVPVADERSTTVALAAQGIGVAPGAPFLVRPGTGHVRITIGLVDDPATIATLADQLAAADRAAARPSGRR
ncbi:MAG TPA: aminotransferase class I/II-fold pyridoxal phosphate-dependent enzyme [Acidimicrobiales bacterium]|nr:aminotransferase class I/II-fold pyridoxal phosphate-dependent enzyme [Acidimicrobiales bacterium]